MLHHENERSGEDKNSSHMFNPFVRFVPELIDAFLTRGHYLLVSQTFRAGVDMFTEERRVLMFSHYNDMGFAQIHLQAIRTDPFAYIVDLRREKHLAKVREILAPGSPYLVFSKRVRDERAVEQFADRQYAHKQRRYLDRHIDWKISKSAHLRPKLQLIFGELFVVLKYQSQQLRVRLEEIDRMRCAISAQ